MIIRLNWYKVATGMELWKSFSEWFIKVNSIPEWGCTVWCPIRDLAQWPKCFFLGHCAVTQSHHILKRKSVSWLWFCSQCILGSWSPLCCCSSCFLLSEQSKESSGVLSWSLDTFFKDSHMENDVTEICIGFWWSFFSFYFYTRCGNLVQNIKKILK